MKNRQTLVTVLVIVLILFSSLLVKIYVNARSELKVAKDFHAQENLKEASTHYQRSLGWFFPGLDFKEQAAGGLWQIAEKYETSGDLQQALDTFRLLRGSFYGARSFYTPGRNWIDRCDHKIAELMARQPPPSETDAAKSFEERKKEYLAILTGDKSPYPLWAFLCELGFLGWVTCCLLFIFKGLTPSGSIRTRPALLWSTGFLLFYGIWILGMANT